MLFGIRIRKGWVVTLYSTLLSPICWRLNNLVYQIKSGLFLGLFFPGVLLKVNWFYFHHGKLQCSQFLLILVPPSLQTQPQKPQFHEYVVQARKWLDSLDTGHLSNIFTIEWIFNNSENIDHYWTSLLIKLMLWTIRLLSLIFHAFSFC